MRIGPAVRSWLGRKPPLLRMERKLIRFERVAERLADLLEWFADLEEKQTGKYILDRQYIEARIDGTYDLARQILYDANVICESAPEEAYEALDRLHGISSRMVRELEHEAHSSLSARTAENPEWEWLALERIRQQLGAAGPEGGPQWASAPSRGSLLEVAAEAHDRAAIWIWRELFLPEDPPRFEIFSPDRDSFRLLVFLTQNAEGTVQETDLDGTWLSPTRGLPLFWTRQLLEGILEGVETEKVRTLRIEPENAASRNPDRPGDIRLCLSEPMILVRFPPVVPVRLLLSSLAPLDRDNLFYLLSAPLQAQMGSFPRSPAYQRKPSSFTCFFQSHASWTCCVRGLSPLQMGERIRLLGRRLSKGIVLSGQGIFPNECTELLELLGGLSVVTPAETEAEHGSTSAGHGG